MDSDFRKNSIINNNLKYFFEHKKKTKFESFVKNWDKYVYTFTILFMYFCYGLIESIFPAAMVDMKYMFGTTMTLINYVITFNSLGFLIGSLCGFLYFYINRQLTFVVLCSAMAIFYATIPFCTELWQIWLCSTLTQVGVGAFEGGNTIWVVEMWKKNSAPILQLTKALYGMGTIAGPLITKQYLFGELDANNSTDLIYHGNTTTIMTKDELNESIDRRPHLKWPFLFAGGVIILVPVILLTMFVLKRYKEATPEVQRQLSQQLERMPQIQSIGTAEKLVIEMSPKRKWTLIVLTSISLSTIGGFVLINFQYCVTYLQMLPLRLSAKTAANIASLMATTYTVTKIFAAGIAFKVKAEIMISYHFVILVIAMAVLYFGSNSELMLWVGNGLLGVGLSAIWPAYLSFAEEYIGLTNVISSIFAFSSAIIPMVSPFICGPLIEKHPNVFLIVEFAYITTTIILFMITLFIAKRARRSPDIYTINY